MNVVFVRTYQILYLLMKYSTWSGYGQVNRIQDSGLAIGATDTLDSENQGNGINGVFVAEIDTMGWWGKLRVL